jgi:hypothetical protein
MSLSFSVEMGSSSASLCCFRSAIAHNNLETANSLTPSKNSSSASHHVSNCRWNETLLPLSSLLVSTQNIPFGDTICPFGNFLCFVFILHETTQNKRHDSVREISLSLCIRKQYRAMCQYLHVSTFVRAKHEALKWGIFDALYSWTASHVIIPPKNLTGNLVAPQLTLVSALTNPLN